MRTGALLTHNEQNISCAVVEPDVVKASATCRVKATTSVRIRTLLKTIKAEANRMATAFFICASFIQHIKNIF